MSDQIKITMPEKIIVSYKDPDMPCRAVDDIVCQIMNHNNIKKSDLTIEEEDNLEEKAQKLLEGLGEYLDIEIDLSTGKKKIMP